MAAALYNILVEQGATFKRTITITNSDGSPTDITGWAFQGQIRKTYDAPQVIASFSFTPDPDPTTGQFTFRLEANALVNFTPEKARDFNRIITKAIYDIEGTQPNGEIVRVVQGNADISPEVTKAVTP